MEPLQQNDHTITAGNPKAQEGMRLNVAAARKVYEMGGVACTNVVSMLNRKKAAFILTRSKLSLTSIF